MGCKVGYFFLDFAGFLVCFAGVFLDAPLLGVLRAICIPPFGVAMRDNRAVRESILRSRPCRETVQRRRRKSWDVAEHPPLSFGPLIIP